MERDHIFWSEAVQGEILTGLYSKVSGLQHENVGNIWYNNKFIKTVSSTYNKRK